MRSNPVKRRIADGGVSIGTFVFEFDSTGIGRLAAGAGAEFVVFDMEHTGWSVETIRSLVATTRSTDMMPFVRIPATEYHFVARVLDMGATGIMVPMVESREQAERIVEFGKYPPVGRRGAAFGVSHDDYTGGDVAAKVSSANTETLLIAQIESAAGLENVDAIASVGGIDVLWIGHFDLTNSLGIPGEFDHPRFKDAVRTIVDTAERHGKSTGFMAGSEAEGRQRLDEGFRILAYGGDLWLYQGALRAGIDAMNEHVRSASPSARSR